MWLAAAGAAGQTAEAARGGTRTAAGSPDAKFAINAAKGGMMEVEMGRMAAEKATSPDVKQFGQRMVDDHSKANDELKAIASGKGMTLPAAVDAAGKAKMDKMSKLTGAAFDRAYMADMVKDHKKDVAEFRKEAKSGKDPDIKGFASKTLPTLEEHLKMAQDTTRRCPARPPGEVSSPLPGLGERDRVRVSPKTAGHCCESRGDQGIGPFVGDRAGSSGHRAIWECGAEDPPPLQSQKTRQAGAFPLSSSIRSRREESPERREGRREPSRCAVAKLRRR